MSVFIHSALVLSPDLADQPLDHARIGYDSILTASNITVSTAESGFPGTALVNPATYERWKPTALTATVNIDAGSAVPVDYIGFAAHTMGTSGNLVTVFSSTDGISYTQRLQFSPGTDQAIMGLFDEITARYWRVTIANGSIPEVGVLYLGKALAMQRKIYGGHSPITLSRKTAVRPSVSETGQWLGASQERIGLKSQYQWQHLTPDWYRTYFDPFVATNPKAIPFFIAWRPQDYPDEVAYCWANEDIQPSNMGLNNFMSVSMSVEGFVDV